MITENGRMRQTDKKIPDSGVTAIKQISSLIAGWQTQTFL